MNYNLFVFIAVLITVAIVGFIVSYDDTEHRIEDRKIVCMEGYKYITVKYPYSFAFAPLIKDDKFVRCGYNG